ncbi:GlxA family transcriptional regulator [Patulibacter defluvii]|uniref:GlxA family transcriptional regulator n=1 Tax=Patulibacter defluvii TaxID=3095358 RepID=UPI002A749375|nr:helix-turn-helix domain-containing protein [Patulibacter sp. DM4]
MPALPLPDAPETAARPHEVVALVLPDVVLLDLAAPCHLFGHIGHPHYRLRVAMAPATPSSPDAPIPDGPGDHATTIGPLGLTLASAHGLEALDDADTIVVPGYGRAARVPPPAAVLDALRRAAARGARVMSVCTGAFALAHAGLLDGRRATTHWHDSERLATQFPKVTVDPDVLYVDAGAVLTSAGVAAGLDLCLHVVRRDLGAEVAATMARRTVVAPHRDGGQAQFIHQPVPDPVPGGVDLERTRAWAQRHLDRPLDVATLARHAQVSERTFARRFRAETGTTPARWIAQRRVALARELLERDDRPIEAIALACGFGDAAVLRAHFARIVGTTPTAYRRTFRGRGPLPVAATGGR